MEKCTVFYYIKHLYIFSLNEYYISILKKCKQRLSDFPEKSDIGSLVTIGETMH